MKNVKFSSAAQFLFFLVFVILAGVCLVGGFSNPFHFLSSGMCFGLAFMTYSGW